MVDTGVPAEEVNCVQVLRSIVLKFGTYVYAGLMG